jgi:alpha-tubulin suppressor-like RCC1 family protein
MNGFGELGNGSTSLAKSPVAVSGGLKFTAIAAGDYHTCGIAAGTVYCWGDDSYGQLGDGISGTSKTVPTAAQSSFSFLTIAAGGFHTCAIASDSKAYCWGDNSTGELGDSELTKSFSAVPVPVAGNLAFKSIAVGGYGAPAPGVYAYSSTPPIGHSCGVTTDGVTYCWGSNMQGELGTSPYANASRTAVMQLCGSNVLSGRAAKRFLKSRTGGKPSRPDPMLDFWQ